MATITIADKKGVGLFSLPDDAVCPRIGEILHFNFAVFEGDKQQWATASWDFNMALHDSFWKVLKVEHHVRRNSIQSTRCVTWVTVKRIRPGRGGKI